MGTTTKPDWMGQALRLAAQLANRPAVQKPIEAAEFAFNGLATAPRPLERGRWGLLDELLVWPNTCAVLTGRDGFRRVYPPGSFSLYDVPLGPAMVQYVLTTRQLRQVGPVEGLSSDKWRVALTLKVGFRVSNPVQVAAASQPLATLEAVVASCTLAQIEATAHDALTGVEGGEGEDDWDGGLETVATQVLLRAQQHLIGEGLELLDLVITERAGDERRAEIMQKATVERAQLAEEQRTCRQSDETRLQRIENLRRLAEQEQELALVEAEGELRRVRMKEAQRLVAARVDVEIARLQRLEEEWRAELDRRLSDHRLDRERERLLQEQQHAETLAVIAGTTQVTTEAVRSGAVELPYVSARRHPEWPAAEGDGLLEQVREVEAVRAGMVNAGLRTLQGIHENGGRDQGSGAALPPAGESEEEGEPGDE
jgi:hypothetical protein